MSTGGSVAPKPRSLSAGGPELLAHERHGLILVQVAALTDASDERAQVVGADRAVDDLALADVRLGGVRAQDRRHLRVADHGVPTIHLSIGIAPLSVECERISVISDPAQALDHIAADTVAALRAGVRRRT